MKGLIRIWKEINILRGTHRLKTTEGEISQNKERKKWREGNSLAGDHRGRGKSGHRKTETEQESLTLWRPQRKEQVSTQKEVIEQAAHKLGTTEQGTN
jgi:hypothetical protein